MTPSTLHFASRDKLPIQLSEMAGFFDTLQFMETELRAGLDLYWTCAGKILDGSGIRLAEPNHDYFSLKKNFFSTLFLYSFFRGGVPGERRTVYVAVNQCLRGMVTGCDNLLDDEYKITLDTDLPDRAHRFRSVLDIMVSDRVLTEILLDLSESAGLSLDVVRKAAAASLHALTRSGVQEASEEGGITGRLMPREVLSKVHHYKTGLLFQCTWAVPEIFERSLGTEPQSMKTALYRIGLGCQILDDMVDLMGDIRTRRHNYVASLVHHGADEPTRRRLFAAGPDDTSANFFRDCPKIFRQSWVRANELLESGLRDLFQEYHAPLAAPAAAFIAGRIGADRLLDSTGS